MRIGERYSVFRQPFFDIRPRCADEFTSRESVVVGHLVENKVREDQGIGFPVRVELCFGQSQALKFAFKNVNAERRQAVTNLPEHLCGELSKQTKLALREVNIRN